MPISYVQSADGWTQINFHLSQTMYNQKWIVCSTHRQTCFCGDAKSKFEVFTALLIVYMYLQALLLFSYKYDIS